MSAKPKAKPSSRATKTHTIDDLPTLFLLCRTFGHAWEEFVPVGMRTPEWGFRFSLLCIRCGTERHDLIDLRGKVGHRGYYYPDGYQLGFKLRRDEARIELNERKRDVAKREIVRRRLKAV